MKIISVFPHIDRNYLFAIGVIGLIVHIAFFQSINSIMLLPFLFYWFLLGAIYRLNDKYFFGIALLFLILSIPPFLLGYKELAERLSVWEFLFLILGLWQWFIFEIVIPKIKK